MHDGTVFTRPTLQHRGRHILHNARLCDPESGLDEQGAVLIEDGVIADLGAHIFTRDTTPEDAELTDCRGLLLAPGLIDLQVHLCEPGLEKKETIESGTMAAAAGGITTVVAQPNTVPVVDDTTLVSFIHQRSRDKAFVRVETYGAITKGLQGEKLAEMGLMTEAGAIGFTDGPQPVMNSLLMRRAMETASILDHPICHHVEDSHLTANGCVNEGRMSTRLGVDGMPRLAENSILQRDLGLQALTGCRYHARHLSARESMETMRAAKAKGQQVSCEVTPHHLLLTEDALEGFNTLAKTTPPLRSEEDRQALLTALQDGTIDAITSDHTPHERESKDVPLASAAFGIAGLETLLPLSLKLVQDDTLSLHQLLALLTCKPADILGLPTGRLQKGKPADLIVIDLNAEGTLTQPCLKGKSYNTPFLDMALKGRVLHTLVGGETVYHATGAAA